MLPGLMKKNVARSENKKCCQVCPDCVKETGKLLTFEGSEKEMLGRYAVHASYHGIYGASLRYI